MRKNKCEYTEKKITSLRNNENSKLTTTNDDKNNNDKKFFKTVLSNLEILFKNSMFGTEMCGEKE